jgi:hypothetical protein
VNCQIPPLPGPLVHSFSRMLALHLSPFTLEVNVRRYWIEACHKSGLSRGAAGRCGVGFILAFHDPDCRIRFGLGAHLGQLLILAKAAKLLPEGANPRNGARECGSWPRKRLRY